MKGSALTPLARIAVGTQALGLVAFHFTDTSARWVPFVVACLANMVAASFADSAARQLTSAIEAKVPGHLESYSVEGWSPFLTKAERRVRLAASDPALLAVSELQSDIVRARELMPLGVAAQAIWLVFIVSKMRLW